MEDKLHEIILILFRIESFKGASLLKKHEEEKEKKTSKN